MCYVIQPLTFWLQFIYAFMPISIHSIHSLNFICSVDAEVVIKKCTKVLNDLIAYTCSVFNIDTEHRPRTIFYALRPHTSSSHSKIVRAQNRRKHRRTQLMKTDYVRATRRRSSCHVCNVQVHSNRWNSDKSWLRFWFFDFLNTHTSNIPPTCNYHYPLFALLIFIFLRHNSAALINIDLNIPTD